MKQIRLIIFVIFMTMVLAACSSQSIGLNSLEIYLVSGDLLQAETVDINSLALEKTPILALDDIQKYDWDKQAFVMKKGLLFERFDKKFGQQALPVSGIPYVVVVNGERIYMGKFWTALSSIWPYSPSIMIEGVYRIDSGWYGLEPEQQSLYCVSWNTEDMKTWQMIFDKRIYEALDKKGLLFESEKTKSSVSEEQKAALANCIEYIRNSSFDRKDAIDTGIVSVETLSEDTKDSVWINDNGISNYFGVDQPEHWVFTIGDTIGHDFAVIVCNSETSEVIGHIPIA